MITKRLSQQRGQTDAGWLRSQHSFSFGSYFDPAQTGFRTLRVINEDHVSPGGGFPTHPHHDMEILTYVVSGELQHRDSMGNGRIIRAGQLQAMTAGSGIHHSEFNPSAQKPVHFLQIWIRPRARGLTPAYSEWSPTEKTAQNGLTLLASPEGGENTVKIEQEARLYLGELENGAEAKHRAESGHGLWLQVISGRVDAAGEALAAGDALAVEGREELQITAQENAKFLLFDLA